ncbi:metal-dependent hydrolase [Longimicrobium sp.]|uniref:metal-dependent hydrolase n=1 Tax=Longimicrobium sp. TaxID=2029185 RepID=UPI002E34EFBB|nr:metal-dependent hydrolase [Longimicrobium sp.]HEX6039965.1 metal-dependent hydrolase [Longimicrobium sp.]
MREANFRTLALSHCRSVAFPPAHMLIGAGMAEVARATLRNPPPRRLVWPIAAVLAAGPDADIIIGILRGVGGALHGTFSHSILAAVIVALAGYSLGGGRWALIAGLSYASHMLVDLLDESGPTNLMLGWPFTGAHPYSIGKLFPKVPVDGNGVVDTAMNVLRGQPLINLIVQTLMAAGFFVALLMVASAIRRRRAESEE